MKYIIEDEELKQFIFVYLMPYDKTSGKQLDDFLKDKEPVELIASGEVDAYNSYFDTWNNHEIKIRFFTPENNKPKFADGLGIKDNTNIEIYIKGVK
jgi:hypothetical protein